MNKKLAKKIAHDVVFKAYKCPYCERIVPNYTFLTKEKCIWCDMPYWAKIIAKKLAEKKKL